MTRRAFFRFVSRTPDETAVARKRFAIGRRGWWLIGTALLLAVSAGAVVVVVGMQPVRPGSPHALGEEELLELINKERSSAQYSEPGSKRKLPIPQLEPDEALQKVAQVHAKELSRKQVKSLLEADMNRELEEAGYPAQFWSVVPATTPGGLPEAFQTWMDKNQKPADGMPHPRMVLLNPYAENIGIGVYRDPATKALFVFVILAKKKK